MGVLQYADGLRFVIGFGWIVVRGFVLGAEWSGYSRVGRSDLLLGHDNRRKNRSSSP